jgi:glutamine synthetase adenylyltransferase
MNLQRALAYSRYAGRALAAFPEIASDLETAAAQAFDWTAPAASVTGAESAAELGSTLRTLRRRVFLHTMVRDLTGRASLTECARR